MSDPNNAPIRKMTVGDRVPNFNLKDTGGAQCELYNTDLTGGPIILVVTGQGGRECLRQFTEQAGVFDGFGAHRYAVDDPHDTA